MIRAAMAEWQHGLFGCFSNIGLCLITYFVPCYTFGKNAEAVGDSCLLCCLVFFVPFLNVLGLLSVRGKIRSSRNIGGSIITDFLAVMCCTFCALVQEAQEVQAPRTVVMIRA
ncbi:Cell number regulator 3 [Bulinus truncatus]|nr:Cell number regulator 3 [Bulinus truncatus]